MPSPLAMTLGASRWVRIVQPDRRPIASVRCRRWRGSDHGGRPRATLADPPRSLEVEAIPRASGCAAAGQPIERDDQACESEARWPSDAVLDPREATLVDAREERHPALADAGARPPVIQPATEHLRRPPVDRLLSATSNDNHRRMKPRRTSLAIAHPCDAASVIADGGAGTPVPATPAPARPAPRTRSVASAPRRNVPSVIAEGTLRGRGGRVITNWKPSRGRLWRPQGDPLR